ncbi:MAG: hypothetical protein Kow0026_28430 [Oricola sp.]
MKLSFLHDVAAFSPAWFALGFAGLGIGFGAGLLHFRSLRAVARRFVAGDWTAVLLQVARLALLAALLYLLARLGAQVLVAGAAGIVLARRRVLLQLEAGR